MISPIVLEKMENSLVDFRYVTLSNDEENELPPADFHYELSDLLLKNTNNIAIEMFRESGKSAFALRAYPLHRLAYPKRKQSYIILIKKNQTLASAKLKEIIEEYKTNPLLRHNFVEIKQENDKVFSVDVKDENGEIINVRIEAYGKGASIRGLSNQDRRPDVIIIDDPQDHEDSRSSVTLEADWNWFLSDIKFLGKKARIFLIGNNLGERCIIERVITNQKNLKFIGLRKPVMLDGKSTWPAQNTIESIEEEKADFAALGKLDIWYAEKMCQAVSEETRTFNKKDYRYYSPSLIQPFIQECPVFATLDPASSSNPESCLRAIVVNAIKEDNWNILDVKYGRWDSAETLDLIFEVVKQYGLKHFGIEKGHYQQVLEPFLLKEMKKRNIFFEVIPLEHAKQGTKLERIKMLQPRFKAHSIWFPEGAEWLGEMEAELGGVTKDAIKSQYIDCVDALAMQEQMAALSIEYLFSKEKLEACKRIEASKQIFKSISVMALKSQGGNSNIAVLVKGIDSTKFSELKVQKWDAYDDNISVGKALSLYSEWKPDIVVGDVEGLGLNICSPLEKTVTNFIKFNGSEKATKRENATDLYSDGFLCLKDFIDNGFLHIMDELTLTQLGHIKVKRTNGKIAIERKEELIEADVVMMSTYALTYFSYMVTQQENIEKTTMLDSSYDPFGD